MGDWVPVVGMGVLALIASTTIVLRGPIGKALAQWIASWSTPEHKELEAKVAAAYAPGGGGVDVTELRDEVSELRAQLEEVQERLDFAERMLAKPRDPQRVGPGNAG